MNFNPGLMKMKIKMKESVTEFNEGKSTPIAMVAPELKQNADDTEITKTCAVLGCDDSKSLRRDELFRFPEDPGLRQIWTDLTGRNNWTPTDYSYMCIQHFSVDCFTCNSSNEMVLAEKAVPSLKLPKHVLEVEYIDEDSLDNEGEELDEDYMDYDEDEIEFATNKQEDKGVAEASSSKQVNGSIHIDLSEAEQSVNETDNVKLLELFTQVQMMQRKVVGLRDKLKYNTRTHNRQSKYLNRLRKIIEIKKNLLSQKRKKKARILLSLQDKIKEDTTGLVMAMPMKHTDDLKNFALSIYKYSPQAYVYIRNTLRTLLPSTDVLDTWLTSEFTPRNLLTSNNIIKVTAEQTETELTCKVTIR